MILSGFNERLRSQKRKSTRDVNLKVLEDWPLGEGMHPAFKEVVEKHVQPAIEKRIKAGVGLSVHQKYKGESFIDLFKEVHLLFHNVGDRAISNFVKKQVEQSPFTTWTIDQRLRMIRQSVAKEPETKGYELLMNYIQLCSRLRMLESVYSARKYKKTRKVGAVDSFCPHCFRFSIRCNRGKVSLCDKHEQVNSKEYRAAKAKIDEFADYKNTSHKYVFEKLNQQRLYSKPYVIFELMEKIEFEGLHNEEYGEVIRDLIAQLPRSKEVCFSGHVSTSLPEIVERFTSRADFNADWVKPYLIANPVALCQTLLRYENYLDISHILESITKNPKIKKRCIKTDILAHHQSGLSGSTIARQLGCSRQYVSRIIKDL